MGLFGDNIVVVEPGRPTVGRIDVHEHKAPTADSARLLKELQDSVEKRLLASLPIANTFGESWLLKRMSPEHGFQPCLTAVIKLNGQSLTATVPIMPGRAIEETLIALRGALGEVIAEHLLSQAITALEKDNPGLLGHGG